MDLFSVVRLAKSTQIAMGARPTRGGELPVVVATAGYPMDIVQAGQEETPPVVAEAQTNQIFSRTMMEVSQVASLDSACVSKPEGEARDPSQSLKRKAVDEDEGTSTSKRRRPMLSDRELSAEEDTSTSKTTPSQ